VSATATAATTTRTTRLKPGLALAELSLLLVHLAVVVGFNRLYDGNDHLIDLIAFTVVATVLAAVVRRLQLPTAAGLVLGFGGAALLVTWLLFPETATAGLPTGATLDAVGSAIDVAGEQFRTVAAPTAPLTGFQLFAGLGLWGSVWFADWAAFRLRATAEALAPATILFIFCTVLGSGSSRFLVAVLYAGAVLLFAANHRAHLAEMDNAWLATAPDVGARWVRRAALGAGAAIVVVGAVAAPLVPGYDDDAVVRWRNKDTDGGLRTTVSPIVDLRRRLVSQTNREMFTVRANLPSYWRLTSLHEFDGKIWSSGGDYRRAEDRLPSEGPINTSTETITQSIRVQTLTALWVPAAFQARLVDGQTRGLSWDPDSATLIVDGNSENSNGLEYTVTSERPVLDPALLGSSRGGDPEEIRSRYLSLPADFPGIAVAEARRAVNGATSRYQMAKALQDYFQDGSFTYTTDIEPGHDNDALVAFLQNREGYCEQFSGAYAAMARSLGLPARVAVGFTEGERDPENPDTFQVRGVHAHAWPEVYFPEFGWVPFEPTPGRGIPGAEPYTGLPSQQAGGTEDQPEVSTVSTSTSTTTTIAGAASTTTAPEEVPVRGTLVDQPRSEEPGPWPTVIRWVAGLLAVWLLVVLAAPRLRAAARRRPGTDGAVLSAWDDTLDPVRWVTGHRPRPSESHAEFARRVGPDLAELATPFARLADAVEVAAWDAAPVGPDVAEDARQLADQVRAGLRRRDPLPRRVVRRLSWREAFGRVGPTGRARGARAAAPAGGPSAPAAGDRDREPEPVG